ncbi:SDR family NAD(P)-dependent oxidoreductase [Phenylobacterium sp.]|uniref:SDR family NAD(P)-dependent oxidoreductase n=1 Tax=Phenylobacterium sp. TaxID=1871053 RepID=UPI00286ABEF8|nr:SDR family NAD(P)-dependent oxidoreductase [Phenylobacterium sp.]
MPSDPPSALCSFPAHGLAVVIGAGGGVGAAVAEALSRDGRFAQVVGLTRKGDTTLDLTDEHSISEAARRLADQPGDLRLVFDATGVLQDDETSPEKSWRQLDPARLAHAFAVNAIGPALLMKHLLPLFPREGKSVFATLSARVGSIGDNRLGGWYGYRASKAALNQFVATAAVELARQRPHAVCVALHPGTVDTGLSAPHAKQGLEVQTPAEAATRLLAVLDAVTPALSGGFLDHHGRQIPW